MPVDDDHGVRHRIEDGAEVVFPGSQRLFELLFLVDIESNAAEMACDTGLILDQAAARADPLPICRTRAPTLKETSKLPPNRITRAISRVGVLAVLRFEQRQESDRN